MRGSDPPVRIVLVSRLQIHATNLIEALSSFARVDWVGSRIRHRMDSVWAPLILILELAEMLKVRKTSGHGKNGVVLVQFVSLDTLSAFAFRALTGAKVFLYAIGSDIQAEMHQPWPTMLRWLIRNADGVLCVNRSIAESVRSLGGINVHILPTPFNGLGKVEDDQKTFDVVTVGALTKNKMQGFLIRSLGTLGQPVRAAMVGDGPTRTELESEARRHPNCEATFFGNVPRSRVISIMSQSTAYVQCSLREGIPLSVLEAAWVGLPLIVVKDGYTSDLVELYGLRLEIVEERTTEALALAIKHVLANPEKYQSDVISNRTTIQAYVQTWPRLAMGVLES